LSRQHRFRRDMLKTKGPYKRRLWTLNFWARDSMSDSGQRRANKTGASTSLTFSRPLKGPTADKTATDTRLGRTHLLLSRTARIALQELGNKEDRPGSCPKGRQPILSPWICLPPKDVRNLQQRRRQGSQVCFHRPGPQLSPSPRFGTGNVL
jgi:hypothetical protein